MTRNIFGQLATGAGLAALLAGCSATPPVQSTGTPVQAAEQGAPASPEQLLARMSVKRKVAQIIMPDIGSITPKDVRRYRFGTILNGGNSGPYGDDEGPAADWLKLADEFWEASTAPLKGDEPVIPSVWATDAVHGHANVIGATVFPHNIALGATGDADLIRRIGAATAIEIEVTGIDWTFAPTIAVARDDRWGRTYESYSEDPALVARLGAAMVEGLQGRPGEPGFLGVGKVAATAKHFFGDGGTAQGVDQGDVDGDLAELMAIHAAPYPAAIGAGVASVMASFNSINGTKMHGNAPLLTGELRGNLGFGGLVVGDWNGHGQVEGCTNSNCPDALLAGLDVYMVPEDWKALHRSLVKQVKNGTIPMQRLDEAVLRVLRLKQQLGIFGGEVKPSARAFGERWDLLGSSEHRAIAREAVAKSQVILKNSGVLPLKAGARIEVAGMAADNIPQQAGGWSVTWQGGGELTAEQFPGATSIYDGIAAAAREAGGTAVLAPKGSMSGKPDVAIVVFGEEPYAEFVGDRKDLAFRDEEGLELLRAYRARGIPTVAVFLSGRPLWVNREINAADAFVAAWLPGSEGAGVSDVLFGHRPATGRLSFSWPAHCGGTPVNGPEGALFPLGYGRDLSDTSELAPLDETCTSLTTDTGAVWFASGRLGMQVQAVADNAVLPDLRGTGNGITATGIDRKAQEDARLVAFAPGAKLRLTGPESEAGWRIAYQVEDRPKSQVTVTADGKALDITQKLSVAEGKGWREMVLTSACLGEVGEQLTFSSKGKFAIQISEIARDENAADAECSF
ncbi:glycoside hydrolase family 3 N-terminal domain-containing protein [Erythrobacter sp. sf7]|uniref:Glycoside hydrolase family 3 N-terminal domain-containing protein n=1 Tax=Erythrobacter fulvus TaxID=2987523 RepID=A0ABT5JPE0_9SPHN|nr:glycoside hydrolase family 3 protein [Erythrobacter fulvus]MDC8754651.1 glycoside hydrolase family 3 N-terminal domain-containing protein [Erythrobacter fulvus]